MKIEAGKYYRTRDGRKVGPMVYDGNGFWRASGKLDGFIPMWLDCGKNDFFVEYEKPEYDLIAEWTEDAPETGTLAELNVKPGDVVECVYWDGEYLTQGRTYTVSSNGWLPDNDGEDFLDPSYVGGQFRIVSRASQPAPETPKLWRDMTPEEKGALLLAHHEGKVIENSRDGITWVASVPWWTDDFAYRVKPQPPKPREWWIVDGREAYQTYEDAIRAKIAKAVVRKCRIDVTHVREVIEC